MNRISVHLAAAMLLVAIVSLLAVPLATLAAERTAYRRLPDTFRARVDAFSRPDPLLPLLPLLRDRIEDVWMRDRTDMDMRMGMDPSERMRPERMRMPDGTMMPNFDGEAARLALLVRDLRTLRRDAVLVGVLVAVIASVLLAWSLSRALARPIVAVSRAAGRVASGDLSARAEVPRPQRQPAEVRALAHDFDAMAASLERLEAERTSMIADVAHELRNPLATLTLRLEVAADGTRTVDAEEAATLLAQTQLLTRLVDDLRTLSQAEAGRLTLSPEPLDLRTSVGSAVSAHRPAAGRRGLELVADLPADPLTLTGDRDRLLQILHNLIENALRVAPQGSTVRVRATATAERVRVVVEDDGPGFAVDPPDAIFERFVRDQRRDTRGAAGSGLGLAIVRTLVELHGGTVFARREGETTQVGFELPLRRTVSASPSTDRTA